MENSRIDPRLYQASQLVGEAVDCLVGVGTRRERVHSAAKSLVGLAPDAFAAHPDLKARFGEINKRLTAVSDAKNGSYWASVESMSPKAMTEVCRAIVDLDRAIQRFT